MNEKWDIKKLKKEMDESKDELFELQKRLLDVVVDFCLRALKSFKVASPDKELNLIQINQIIVNEIHMVAENILMPKFQELAIQKTEMIFNQ